MIASHVPALTRPTRHHLVLATAATGLAAVIAVTAVSMAGPARAAGPPDPGLGTALDYSVLAGEGVTNTGSTTVVGLVASAGIQTTVADNGAISPPGNVRRGANLAVSAAKADLLVGYGQAAAAPVIPNTPLLGEIGGQTLTGGTYTRAGSLGFTSTLTLDGENDPSSVFIIQVAADFNVASSAQVVFTRGAQACHVYWQIGNDAVIGTNTDFQGTILAGNDISAQTGATFAGRLLSNVGAITLDSNTFTSPVCAAATTAPPSSATPTATTPAPTATTRPTPRPTKSTGSGKGGSNSDSDGGSSDGTGGGSDSDSDGSDGGAGDSDSVGGDDSDADAGTSSSTGIPDAGGPPLFLAPVGALAVLVGAGLVMASRRRQHGAHRG
ncbi:MULTISPECIES: ice-binding family protein [Aeromicrobium]|uniref:ice-binding family protein n=1 Tax=Aeromicrobium TaxID=2040 RepID=UPI0006FC1A34|nr:MULTISPECIES: ice-binding family protein [Aeromicrobium]KQX74546.1 hypothetical protein ASD10_04760 [Aeromicrobium sp. Root472D3]MCL8249971.1 ice-binding family protein [Aeromicrobium fastidiosum]